MDIGRKSFGVLETGCAARFGPARLRDAVPHLNLCFHQLLVDVIESLEHQARGLNIGHEEGGQMSRMAKPDR